MANALPNSAPPDSSRLSIRPPRPLWIALATVVLVVVGAGLRIGLPIYRQQVAIREIERVGGRVEMQAGGPEWLRGHLSVDLQKFLDEVVAINLTNEKVTDATLAHLRW